MFKKVSLEEFQVAIHNKNGQGLLRRGQRNAQIELMASQSTIKMDKGYYKMIFIRRQSAQYSRNPQ